MKLFILTHGTSLTVGGFQIHESLRLIAIATRTQARTKAASINPGLIFEATLNRGRGLPSACKLELAALSLFALFRFPLVLLALLTIILGYINFSGYKLTHNV